MSDLIKKIKIKRQDDTYTDYISIGAEAKNVDCSDGESVEIKLNKKPYYYNNVADMKADKKLKIGDMAITLGYYEPNDGGAAEYKVVDGEYVDDGGSYHQLDNNLFAELIIKNYIYPEQFGAYGDGKQDDTIKIQNIFNFFTHGGCLLLQVNKAYKITNTINVPENVSIQGINDFNDISGKANYAIAKDILKGMSSFIMVDNAQFLLKGNNSIEKICIVYPNQNYDIKSIAKSTQNPDGLTNFIQYNPTFTLTGNYIGLVFKDIIYLGGTQFLYCGANVNPEKLYVDRVVGMCVGTAFKIINCKDMMYFHNIHMNANSLKCYIQKANNGNDKNFYTKCAKNSVLFSFGESDYGCDGAWINNCFSYGVKRFIELNGHGNSVQLNQCGADVCHEFLYINSSVKPFGTYLNNCVVTPIVYKPIIDGVESSESPCLIRIANNVSDHKIQVTNCTVFGNKVPLIDDSNTCNYVLSCSNSSQNTRINLVNCILKANYLQEGFNIIGQNNISQQFVNGYRILTIINSTLNGQSIDTNINQSKVLTITKNINITDIGVQTISGIGFRANSIKIVGVINSTQIMSDGFSDGNISKCISTDSTGVKFISGGTAVIQQFCENINNRYYAELQSINDDGFVLKWGYTGTPPSGTASIIIFCER